MIGSRRIAFGVTRHQVKIEDVTPPPVDPPVDPEDPVEYGPVVKAQVVNFTVQTTEPNQYVVLDTRGYIYINGIFDPRDNSRTEIDVYWGDDNVTSQSNVSQSYGLFVHSYSNPGTYAIEIVVDINNTNHLYFTALTNTINPATGTTYNATFDIVSPMVFKNTQYFDMISPTIFSYTLEQVDYQDTASINGSLLYNGCTNLTLVNLDQLDTSQVTRLSFASCNKFNDPSIVSLDTSNVTTLARCFEQALVFNQDISGWNVSNVTDMQQMFERARQFNQPIGSWNVSNVTDMNGMFDGANNFNQNISGWNTSKVTDMSYMFRSALKFNQNIGSWNVSNVTTMNRMFSSADVFNQDISGWNTSNVTDMTSMFVSAINFNQDLSSWCVEQIPVEPSLFDYNTVNWTLPRPNWGAPC